MRAYLSVVFFIVGGCVAHEGTLAWVAPMEEGAVPIGDAVELAVATFDANTVRFTLDDEEIAVCDPSQPEEDCKREEVWRWTTVFTRPGRYELAAISLDANGLETERLTRELVVVRELPMNALVDYEIDDRLPGSGSLQVIAVVDRGGLDPDLPFHSAFGGLEWRVADQRVILRTGTPAASVADVRRCMTRYGASIRRWADQYQLSRASVAATALTESNCTDPAGSSDGLSSGPMQVTASTCAAVSGLTRAACRTRMYSEPDFSFQVGAKYMGSSFQKSQHRRDPPKISAAYNAGSLRRSSTNRWHMITTGNHIDRFVGWYNAYRAWELAP